MTRLRLLVKSIVAYVTPLRILLFAVVATGLVLAVVADTAAAVVGVLAAVVSLAVLLAQVNDQSRRYVPRDIPAAASDAPPGHDIASDPVARAGLRDEPLVSVIIPGRNEAPYLADCIESLQRQTLRDFEVIIIDDGSTDSTLDELVRLVGDDPRFRLYRTHRSIGPGAARNLAVSLARAGAITFLDLDDFLAPDSLASRLVALERAANEPWLAGVYCWHQTVAHSTTYATWEVPTWKATSGRISWLQRPDDNVFVVSAPLLRKEAFLAVGGFDDEIAEDARLWLTMLRAGFVFRGTERVDIAYRQKPASRAASDYLGMGRSVAERVAAGQHAMERPPGVDGPYWYGESMAHYRASLAKANRISSTLGMAVALGDTDDLGALVDEIAALPPPVVVQHWEADAIRHARNGAARIALAEDREVLQPRWEAEIERLLRPVVDRAAATSHAWLDRRAVEPPAASTDELRPVRPAQRVTATPESIGSLVDGGRPFLLMPSAAYHTDELTDLVPELRRRGYAPIAMINDFRWTTTAAAMARVDVPVVDVVEPGPWLHRFAGVLVFNDWGEYYADTVRYLDGADVVTFAKVEGVQDWHDRDTGRERRAYLSADIVLCQGDNDIAALERRREGLHLVGSDRLEHIWHDPLPSDRRPSVVANVNFTYGVLTEHRDLWVSTARTAAQRAGLPIALSMHPSERATYPGLAATAPLRHLLTVDSIFVSRFSTALYEAMARGCSVIYYNPHGEAVETFQDPRGAFPIASTELELEQALRTEATRSRAEVKEAAAEFFLRQVSIVDGSPVAVRTADVIDACVGDPSSRTS